MAKRKILSIDSMSGGGGDIWMRLTGLYTVAGLYPEMDIHICIPEFLRNLAKHTFSDRLQILDKNADTAMAYTGLGFRHLLPGLLSGKRYISPYQMAVIKDKKKKELKDVFNKLVFIVADALHLIQVPSVKWMETYQGFLEVKAIQQFRAVKYEDFKTQLKKDFPLIQQKLNNNIPISTELAIPERLNESVVIFPTGTSRQFIPVKWAQENLPDAYYAFFHKDESLEEFRKNGLKTVAFYKEPGDIITLSNNARWTISTDSFPSHVLQSVSEKCTITITEVLKSRIINPEFRGKVIDAVAPCHPCLHLDRVTHVKCSAGFTECLNWKSDLYTKNIINSAGVN